MWQDLITVALVATAAGYSAWKLAPARWRTAAARQTARVARAAGVDEPRARELEVRVVTAAENASGCGNCGPCKGCAVGQAKDESSA